MASGGQSDIGTDTSRSLEARRIVDRRLEAQMRLRGLSGARDEFHLASIVQNLKTLASQLWQPPPDALAANVM